jgi:hypothetical protein
MADFPELSEILPPDPRQVLQDFDMSSPDFAVEISSTSAEPLGGNDHHNGQLFPDSPAEDAPARVTYTQYLKSPVITLVIGHGEDQALLTAHEALLMQSPWFAETCSKFSNDLVVRSSLLLLCSLT